MNQTRCHIFQAEASALDDILSLLSSVQLPHEGVREHLSDFLVARDEAGELVGCIGAERYERLALLRSLAIRPEHQRSGLGSQLTAALLARLAQENIAEVALLTTTAQEFFARNFGFRAAPRADYDELLAESPEWRLPRCATAAFMKLDLAEK